MNPQDVLYSHLQQAVIQFVFIQVSLDAVLASIGITGIIFIISIIAITK